jgi:mannose-6-phosphate isomerase-like protein (cupin superfamily)
MNQHEFDALLQKYLSGECSRDEEKQVQEWSAHMLLRKIPLSETEQRAIKKSQWKKLRSLALGKQPFLVNSGWLKAGAAAAVLFLVGYIGVRFNSFFKVPDKQPVVAESTIANPETDDLYKITNVTEVRELVLEDGSVITLKKGSSMSYPKHFDNKSRKIYLEGEAFFKVKKDPSRPFMVYTGELVTQVLGTTFSVKSNENAKTIEVQVVSGRVSVYEKQQTGPQNRNGVILNPNQKITFDVVSKKLVPGLVEAPVLLSPPETKNEFMFDEVAVPKVLATIQHAYHVEIVVETPNLDSCIFTGDLNSLSLHSKLKLLCESVNATYELRGTTFFLQGKGCAK